MSRLFWPVIILAVGTLVACIVATAGHAQDAHVWESVAGTSTIRLQPTDAEGAVAEVVFDNKAIHSRDEDLTFDLTSGGFTVTVTASVGRGAKPDRIEVICPPGYYALPATLDVQENDTDRVLIYSGEMVLG